MEHLLTNATAQMMSEIPQLQGEPADSYIGLLTWVKTGMPEDAELSKLTGFTTAKIRKYKEDNDWQHRLDSSVYGLQAQVVNNRLAEMTEKFADGKKTSQLLRELAQRTAVKLLVADTMTDAPVMRIQELASAIKSIFEVERLEAGESTENVAVAVAAPDLSELTLEEKRALRKALPKAFKEE